LKVSMSREFFGLIAAGIEIVALVAASQELAPDAARFLVSAERWRIAAGASADMIERRVVEETRRVLEDQGRPSELAVLGDDDEGLTLEYAAARAVEFATTRVRPSHGGSRSTRSMRA